MSQKNYYLLLKHQLNIIYGGLSRENIYFLSMGLRPPNNNIFLNLRGTSKILAQVFIFIMSQQRPRNNLECSLLISTIMFQFD